MKVLHNIFFLQVGNFGRDGPTVWRLRYPDLNPPYFFLWGHRKAIVYATEVSDVHDLQKRIQNGTEMFVPGLEFSCQPSSHGSDVQLTA
jgi:hypothetical protein